MYNCVPILSAAVLCHRFKQYAKIKAIMNTHAEMRYYLDASRIVPQYKPAKKSN